ncbi:hypothetical protein [Halomicrobium urmianum]|uniref:hypothetical protein n=1 Tax=Halomicrobium urmianum TaxID=1586233 RepID=UPI001CD9C721|nr:hypothetical protein [Halomicrobium urmianum]
MANEESDLRAVLYVDDEHRDAAVSEGTEPFTRLEKVPVFGPRNGESEISVDLEPGRRVWQRVRTRSSL